MGKTAAKKRNDFFGLQNAMFLLHKIRKSRVAQSLVSHWNPICIGLVNKASGFTTESENSLKIRLLGFRVLHFVV
jgi:hypothetical protein